MKKLLSITLMLVLCMAFTACADDSGSGNYEEDESHFAAEDMEPGTALGNFSSTDLEGNEVTQAVFAEKDVTVLNVWATYCGPCKDEMPELSAWDAELPDNAQIIGIVTDVSEGDSGMIAAAQAICDDNHITFTNITMNDSVAELLTSVEAVPTTFILDREGRMVCTPIIGAYIEDYQKAAADYLDQLD